MSFGLRLLLVVGSGMFLFGAIQLLWGWYYTGIVQHEATATGTIRVARHGGRHDYYEYSFSVGSHSFRDADDRCEAALTRDECEVGTLVIVHYDNSDPTTSKLNAYSDLSREALGLGIWMTPTGLCLLLGFYLLLRGQRSMDTEDDLDEKSDEHESEILHIVPDDKA